MATKILMTLLGLSLVLLVACGGVPAAPEATATQAADTAPAAEPTSVPALVETSQPTATPQMAAPPAEVAVNPGKLTVMVGDFSDEQFGAIFGGGSPGEHNYYRLVGGFLISDNERKEMVPGIASKWDLADDGLTWSFTIREGVKFHDGSEVTPEDVLWTLLYTFGPEVPKYTNVTGQQPRVSRELGKVELSGPDTVSMTLGSPVPQMATWLSEADVLNYHVMPKRAKLRDTEADVAYDNNPIGAGPMKLEERVPASVMKFERFDDFYFQPENGFPEDKRVNFQSLDMFLVPEEATRVAAIRAGETDIAPASLASKDQVEAGGGRLVFGQEGLVMWVILVGCYDQQYPCHDKRVRQALEYAIDKELIRDRLFGGPEVFQVKGWYVVTPSSIGYSPEIDPFPFDPEKARQLLADAGYPGGQGFGKLIVNTFPSTAMPFLVESAQLGADMWRRELGLDVEVRVGDSVGISDQYRAYALEGQIIWRDQESRIDAASTVVDRIGDPTSYSRLHADPELFRLTQETYQILDPDKRAEASKEFYRRVGDEALIPRIGYMNIPWAVGPRVLTWRPYPMALWPSALHTIILK